MDPKTILVLTIASLDILLGLVVFLQDRRSSINRAYSFFAMSVSMWGFGVGFFLMSNQQEYANFLARLLYFGGGLIPAAFYYFSLVFYSERPISFLLRFIIFSQVYYSLFSTFLLMRLFPVRRQSAGQRRDSYTDHSGICLISTFGLFLCLRSKS